MPLVIKDPSSKLRLQVARYSIPFTAVAASYIAFGAEKVVAVLVLSIAPLLAMTIVPFVLCFWWDKANRYGALAGIFGGLIGWLVALALETETPADLIGFGVSLVAMVSVALLTQSVCPAKPLTNIDGEAVVLKDRLATLRFRKN